MTSATIWPICSFFVLFALFAGLQPARGQEAFIVVEANSGRILMAHGALDRKPIASLTKIATAMVVLDWAVATKTDLGTRAVVPNSAAQIGGANPMGLIPGQQITLRDALYSALLGSDNVAAQTVAHHVGAALLRARNRSGDPVGAFVKEMNELAKALEMRKTKFTNVHGMDHVAPRGYSTATDVARLCIYAMRKPGFAFFVKQKSRKVSVSQGGQARGFTVKNTNQLLGQQSINGIKTGMTAQAGQCLATSSELKPSVKKLPDGRSQVTARRLICVVLGSQDRFGRTGALIKQGWGFYEQWMQGGAVVKDPARELLQVGNPR